jgi:hypothetical protein
MRQALLSFVIFFTIMGSLLLWNACHRGTDDAGAEGQDRQFKVVFDGAIFDETTGGYYVKVYRGMIDGKPCLIAQQGPHGIGISCDWHAQ